MKDASVGRNEESGFVAQINEAEDAYQQRMFLSSYLQYATAYYSHFGGLIKRSPFKAFNEFCRAKGYALAAKGMMKSNNPEVTHAACDVVGTILLRSWLWEKADPAGAAAVLTLGLAKRDADQISVVLMQIGMAEAHFLMDDTNKAKEYLLLATREIAAKIAQASNKTQAIRQIFIMLRRAAVLSAKLGDKELESSCLIAISNLRAFAGDEVIGKDQIRKFGTEQKILRLPKWLQKLLPQ